MNLKASAVRTEGDPWWKEIWNGLADVAEGAQLVEEVLVRLGGAGASVPCRVPQVLIVRRGWARRNSAVNSSVRARPAKSSATGSPRA